MQNSWWPEWRGVCGHACMSGIHVCGSSLANSGSSKGRSRRKVHATEPHAILKARGNLMLNYAGSSLTGSLLPIDAFFFFRTTSYLSLKTERLIALGGEFNLLVSIPTSTRVSRYLTCELLTLPLPPTEGSLSVFGLSNYFLLYFGNFEFLFVFKEVT